MQGMPITPNHHPDIDLREGNSYGVKTLSGVETIIETIIETFNIVLSMA